MLCKLSKNSGFWIGPFRVAYNHLLDDLKQQSRRQRLLTDHLETAHNPSQFLPVDQRAFFEHEVRDDLLRMLFVCCDDAITLDAQLALALKTLCGFGVSEIAQRLFVQEATIYKRLARARRRLQQASLGELHVGLHAAQYAARMPAVHKIIYLLFTEGYLSVHADRSIRRELCAEAIRLAQILVDHPVGQTPTSFALLALMHLHVARLSSRRDGAGGLLLLAEQDRSRWDQAAIGHGLQWLQRSAAGDVFSRYHAEAAIAAEHCLAPSFAATRWDRVAASYEMLERIAPSALHRLNRAVATAEWRGPAAGLTVLRDVAPPAWMLQSYLWSAVHADLLRRNGEVDAARHHASAAISAAPTQAVRTLLQRRLTGAG